MFTREMLKILRVISYSFRSHFNYIVIARCFIILKKVTASLGNKQSSQLYENGKLDIQADCVGRKGHGLPTSVDPIYITIYVPV